MGPSVAERTPLDSQKLTANRPLKIEMVLAQLHVGGMEVMVTHLMRALRQRGHQVGVTCILSEGPLFQRLNADGFRMQLVPTHGWSNLVSPRDLIRWFKSEAADVVHIHSGAWIKAAIAAKRAGTQCVVFTHHGLESREGLLDRALNRHAARYTDRIVAVSDDLKDKMGDTGGVPDRSIDVLPNGVPTDVFTPETSPSELRKRFDIPDDGVIIGNVARMWPVKNHVGLIDAFARVSKSRSDVFLVLVGDGPLRPEIEHEITRQGVTDRVFLTGEIDDLASVYRAFDLFALASHSEGTSISILEALASGTGVVATAVGGTPSLLGDGDFGTLVPPDDADAFADAMNRMLNDEVTRNRLSAAGRERVTQNFSVDAMCDAYEALYYDEMEPLTKGTVPARSAQECVG